MGSAVLDCTQATVRSKTTVQSKRAKKENQHSLNRKDARGRYNATNAKVMTTDNMNVRPKSVLANSKMCSTKGMTSNDGVVYNAACRAQINDV